MDLDIEELKATKSNNDTQDLKENLQGYTEYLQVKNKLLSDMLKEKDEKIKELEIHKRYWMDKFLKTDKECKRLQEYFNELGE